MKEGMTWIIKRVDRILKIMHNYEEKGVEPWKIKLKIYIDNLNKVIEEIVKEKEQQRNENEELQRSQSKAKEEMKSAMRLWPLRCM